MITYRQIDYKNHSDHDDIIRMYREIFNVDFSAQYEDLFRSEHFSDPVGIIAFDDEKGNAVGHFTTVRIRSIIGGRDQTFRMSMGFMTDPGYRGRGIATNLYYELKKALMDLDEKRGFIIGFPNENSVKMHIERMEYHEYRRFHFVTLPRPDGSSEATFTRVDDLSVENCEKDGASAENMNRLYHGADFLNSRFPADKYDKYISDSGNIYISTRFRDKIDILYWSDHLNEEELVAFAGYMYAQDGINRVSTWNSTDYLETYPGEDREYHMCINYLGCSEEEINVINGPWIFYMGDCELF